MTRTRPAYSNRLRLELLEERSVPATLNVNTTLDDVTPANGKFSLREAITKANALAGADTIVVPAGVFKITLPTGAGEDANLTGDFDITDAVTIHGAGAGITLIDAQQLDRVFDVIGTSGNRIKVVFQGLTVRNGKVNGDGGGIRLNDANLVIGDCSVVGNQALLNGDGGGISTAGSGANKVTIARTTVARNVAVLDGGGISLGAGSVLTLKDSVVRRNISGQDGGGIDSDQAILINSRVSGNIAANSAGGIDAGTATLTNCTISGNSAGFGGGINTDSLTLTNCTVSGNTATSGSGGGIRSNTATLTNGTVRGNVARGFGGGINAQTVTLTSCTISGNAATEPASQGGGIQADTATLILSTVSGNTSGGPGGGIKAATATLSGSIISGNISSTSGGGIDADAATLTDSTVNGNRSSSNGGGLNASTATLTRCTVGDNTSGTNGGGLMAVDATLKASTISGNRAGLQGGGIFAATATLGRSTFSGNTAGTNGGGVDATTATMTNCTIAGNTAAANGGGVFATNATLLNCTVAENIAGFGGGLFRNGGVFNVKNTIVALNLVETGGSGQDVFGAFTSQGHNLIGNGSGGTGFTNGVNGDLVGTSLNPIDPKLGPLQNNGGPTKTMALLAGSKAVDAGDNSGAPALDQRGFPRKKDGNGDGLAVVDIGAFEV